MPGGPTNLFKGVGVLCRETKGLESLDLCIARAGAWGDWQGEREKCAGKPIAAVGAGISNTGSRALINPRRRLTTPQHRRQKLCVFGGDGPGFGPDGFEPFRGQRLRRGTVSRCAGMPIADSISC
jgi:hypothetical protein